MRIAAHLLLFTLIINSLLLVRAQDSPSSTNDPVVVNYVSTIAGSTTSVLQGSLMGGTALYIQGVGFDSTFENNLVFVGTIPCSTSAKGVTQTTIVCYTGPYPSGVPVVPNLPISIIVLGKQPFTCATSGCQFTYINAQTPQLNSVYPRASSANQWVNFYGVHRIINLGDGRNMGDVVGLYVGESLCSRFDIAQSAIPFSSNNAYIACSITPTQEGGYYNIKEWVTPGIAKNSPRLDYGSILNSGKSYQFIVTPAVS